MSIFQKFITKKQNIPECHLIFKARDLKICMNVPAIRVFDTTTSNLRYHNFCKIKTTFLQPSTLRKKAAEEDHKNGQEPRTSSILQTLTGLTCLHQGG